MWSDNVAIRVEHLSKRYELYETPRDRLKQFLLPRIQKATHRQVKQYFRDFWALNDVSFAIHKGKSYGIVGLNGSGKSTLLQIITGTLFPTLGNVITQGRITALLELGSGFNADFTGRENVYMNGNLQGCNRKQVDSKLSEIENFADIGDYFDQPLVTYSSGMQVRLAFAVATAFEPDILIIDEALAVGDAYFQQKCFQRIERFREKGGTLLFVSHDMNTIKNLCDQAFLLNNGRLECQGQPSKVIDLYQGMIAQKADTSLNSVEISQNQTNQPIAKEDLYDSGKIWSKATTITTNQQVELVDFKVLDCADRQLMYIPSESDVVVQYRIRVKKDLDRPAYGLIIRDKIGRSIYEISSYAMRQKEIPVFGGNMVLIRFGLNFNLRAGYYSFSVGVANRGYSRSEFEEYSLLMHDVEQIEVLEAEDADFYGGIYNMKPSISIKILEPSHVNL